MNRMKQSILLFVLLGLSHRIQAKPALVRKDVPVYFRETAQINTRESATVSSRILANVLSYRVTAGQSIEKGETLVVLDDKEMVLKKEQARQALQAVEASIRSLEQELEGQKARLVEVESEFVRVQKYFSEGASTKKDLEQATSAFKQARSQLQSLEERLNSLASQRKVAQKAVEESKLSLSWTRVKAPFSGSVSQTFLKSGDLAKPGTPLLSLYSPNQYQAISKVPESLSQIVRPGVPVNIYLRSQKYQARVSELSPSLESSSRSFGVKVNFQPEENYFPGTYAELEVQTGKRNVLLVHSSYVHQMGQIRYVFKKGVTSKVASRQYVRLGELIESDYYEVRSGLTGDEELVLRGENVE